MSGRRGCGAAIGAAKLVLLVSKCEPHCPSLCIFACAVPTPDWPLPSLFSTSGDPLHHLHGPTKWSLSVRLFPPHPEGSMPLPSGLPPSLSSLCGHSQAPTVTTVYSRGLWSRLPHPWAGSSLRAGLPPAHLSPQHPAGRRCPVNE